MFDWLPIINLAHAVEVDVSFGGPSGGGGENIADYVSRVYLFAVGIAGILAVGVIVFGAIYYAVSGGSPDKQRDARSYITNALWGLALLFGSYLILNTINPRITDLSALQQTRACGSGEDPKASGCLPKAPITKPICGTSRSTDCIPACGAGERACTIGEDTSTGCVECAYVAQRCPDNIVVSTPVGNVSCLPGTFKEVEIPGEVEIDVPYNTVLEIGFKKVKFNNGVARFAPYYPASKDSSRAQCIIYAYIKSLEPSEASTGSAGETVINSSRWEKANLKGLKSC